MDTEAAERLWTPEEYLAFERAAAERHEFCDGHILVMAGASPEHNRLTVNMLAGLNNALKRRPCRAYGADLKIFAPGNKGLFAYPDASVVCGPLRYHDEHRDIVINPILICEVLSNSTEAFDRGKKFADYRTLESMQEYVLVAQDRVLVEHFARQPNGTWVYSALPARQSLVLTSLGCEIPVDEIYFKVFDDPPDLLS